MTKHDEQDDSDENSLLRDFESQIQGGEVFGSATVLNLVNDRLEKRFSNWIFAYLFVCASRGVLDFLRHGFQCSMVLSRHC